MARGSYEQDTTKTGDELRAEAAAAYKRVQESRARCGSDGFLSQWAGDLNGNLLRRQATILDDGKRARFDGLYDGDRRVAADLIEGKYGPVWMLEYKEAERYGRRFVPFVGTYMAKRGKTSTVQKELGLHEHEEWAPAWAEFQGSGTGLSGRCWVAVFRTGDRWGLDATKFTEAEVEAADEKAKVD